MKAQAIRQQDGGTPTAERESERSLALSCAARNPDAERAVIQKVFDPVVSTISYAVNSRVYAEDLVQEALLEILGSMGGYRGDCSLETWARRIAVRVAMRAMAKRRRRAALRLLFSETTPEPPRGEAAISERELRLHLNSLVARLPVKQQVAIRLRYVHELGIREIAQIVAAPEETVRNRIKIGKKKLQKVIAGNPAFEGWLNKETGRHAGTGRR